MIEISEANQKDLKNQADLVVAVDQDLVLEVGRVVLLVPEVDRVRGLIKILFFL